MVITVDIEALRRRTRGSVIQPGDAEYDSARRVYNGMIDKRPAAIVRCADVADVIGVVNVGGEAGVLTAIRGGGHNGGGLGTCDGGLLM
jgi:FAD/FMN-containing dehydrogenase